MPTTCPRRGGKKENLSESQVAPILGLTRGKTLRGENSPCPNLTSKVKPQRHVVHSLAPWPLAPWLQPGGWPLNPVGQPSRFNGFRDSCPASLAFPTPRIFPRESGRWCQWR
jgi:hypothetical protein